VLGMVGVILSLGLLVDALLFRPLERLILRRWGGTAA
jgi:hypothetical protein